MEDVSRRQTGGDRGLENWQRYREILREDEPAFTARMSPFLSVILLDGGGNGKCVWFNDPAE